MKFFIDGLAGHVLALDIDVEVAAARAVRLAMVSSVGVTPASCIA